MTSTMLTAKVSFVPAGKCTQNTSGCIALAIFSMASIFAGPGVSSA